MIASITKEDQISLALKSKVNRVILMTGTIVNLSEIISRLHESGKEVFVHIERVPGLGKDSQAILYLAQTFKADGIVTTRSNAITAAKQAGIRSVQRIFAIDTAAVQTAIKMIKSTHPDEVELMPGIMPRIISELKQKLEQPLIVGGLIRHENEIIEALTNGADYVSCGSEKFW